MRCFDSIPLYPRKAVQSLFSGHCLARVERVYLLEEESGDAIALLETQSGVERVHCLKKIAAMLSKRRIGHLKSQNKTKIKTTQNTGKTRARSHIYV